MDKNGIRTRDIDAGFDDGRANQNVIALVIEISHDFF